MQKDKPTLYLIRGVPGSGKSTLAKQLVQSKLAYDCIEADQWFEHGNNGKFDPSKLYDAHKWCQNTTVAYLVIGKSVIVSNTSTTEKEVNIYQEIANTFNANFVSIILENRHGGTNVHNVPPEKVQQMRDRFSVKL